MGLLDVTLQVRRFVLDSKRFMADVTGANNAGLVAGTRVLGRAIRKKLSIAMGGSHMSLRSTVGTKSPVRRVYGTPSAPGEAPRKATGRLQRSVASEVVGGVRRVGPASFVGRLLEQGVDTTVQVTPSGRAFGKRRRKAGQARRTLRIAPRPFMEAALQDALPKMQGEAVSALVAREGAGFQTLVRY